MRWCSCCAAPAVAALMLLCTSPAQAQQVNPYRDLLVSLRDTLLPLRAGVAEFTRDLRGAEADSILVRAADIRRHCLAAAQAVPGSIQQVRGATRSGRARKQAASLLDALLGLNLALRDCEQGFDDSGPGDRVDTLRAWGVFRSKEVEQALRAYDLSASRFAEAVGVTIEGEVQPK